MKTSADQKEPSRAPLSGKLVASFALLYVVIVLIVDTLAVRGVDVPIRWAMFHTNVEMSVLEAILGRAPAPEWSHFDTYKFAAWLLIPLVLSLYTFDFGYFSVFRWRKSDLAILAVLSIFGIGAVAMIPLFPSLSAIYNGLGDQPSDIWFAYATGNLLWMFSWLVGWEFMLRYFLLRKVVDGFGRHAWLMIPLSARTCCCHFLPT